jgi:hypothetical protein
MYAQFGVVTYSGTVTATDGFALNRAGSASELANAINDLTWTNNSATVAADLAGYRN